ncbi:MAG: tetratricopeptide repeat protein, partial [Rubrivivax sp.]
SALVAVGRGRMAAGETDKALAAAKQAQREDAAAPGPVLLALELMAKEPEAEQIVTTHMGRSDVDPGLRLAYVRTLTQQQRYPDAVRELEVVTKQKPDLAPPFLSLGALQLELRHPKEGEAALLRYVDLAQAQRAAAPAPAAAASAAASDDDDGDDNTAAKPEQGLVQAWLMLAQAAEQRGDFKAAETWLAKVDDPQRALEVQTRRASLLARQGRIKEARDVLRAAPERNPEDARAKLMAEAGVLRDVKRWKEAFEVLAGASQKFPDDTDLLYEQAMMAEKLNRMDELERLLRRVIELKPDSAQAYNALGYSLADRRVRLTEARELIKKALDLTPGDPFITDSLGWVEYRLGNRDEALRLLRQAYASRPDPEIAAHLGEVLWAFGQQDEAKKVWIEGKARDSANDVLRETLSRLKVGL